MAVNTPNGQYIGARYVPKVFKNPVDGSAYWIANTEYEALTIVVVSSGDSYTSRQAVPRNIGSPEDNPDYWVKTGDFNASLLALKNKVNNIDEKVGNEALETEAQTLSGAVNELKTGVDNSVKSDELMKTPINRWLVDNEETTETTIDPSTITLNRYCARSNNFDDKLITNKWTPVRNVNQTEQYCTITQNTNNNRKYLEKGMQITTTADTAKFDMLDIMPIKRNQFVHVKFNNDTSSDSRFGIFIGNTLYVTFNTVTQKLYWADNEVSYVDQELNQYAVFTNAKTIELLIFLMGNGHDLRVYAKADNENYIFMNTVTTTEDRSGNVGIHFIGHTVSSVFKLSELYVGYSYLGFSDCRYVHYDDTTPYIVNNKAYLTCDLQGGTGVYMVGIIEHTLGYDDFKLVGICEFNNDYSSMGLDLCFDRVSKKFIATAVITGQDICCGFAKLNNLYGFHSFKDIDRLPTASNHIYFGNVSGNEDPTVCKFNNEWYFAINRAPDSSHSGYYYDIFKCSSEDFDLTNFALVSTLSDNSLTGGSFIAIGNVLYFSCGNGTKISLFNVETGVKAGDFPITTANRVWGNITAVIKGNETKLYLTTFDRTLLSDDNWSYGFIMAYESSVSLSQDVVNNTYGSR